MSLRMIVGPRQILLHSLRERQEVAAFPLYLFVRFTSRLAGLPLPHPLLSLIVFDISLLKGHVRSVRDLASQDVSEKHLLRPYRPHRPSIRGDCWYASLREDALALLSLADKRDSPCCHWRPSIGT